MKRGLQEEFDYCLVPERAWKMMVKKFGQIDVGQCLSREVIEIGGFVKSKIVSTVPYHATLSFRVIFFALPPATRVISLRISESLLGRSVSVGIEPSALF